SLRQSINSQHTNSRNLFGRGHPLHSAQVARISESKHATAHFQGHIYVPRSFLRVKPHKLAVEAEMEHYCAALERNNQVLAAPHDSADSQSPQIFLESCGRLFPALPRTPLHRDRMDHTAPSDPLALYERTQCPRHGFDFRELRHLKAPTLAPHCNSAFCSGRRHC